MVYKRGKYYWFKFQWKGQMMYFSTGQSDARVATNLESKKRTLLAENRGGLKKKKEPPTLRAYLTDNIIPWAEAQHSGKPKTLKWYKDQAGVIYKYKPLADARLDTIKASSLTPFKSARLKEGRAIATVNSTLRLLKIVLGQAVEDELIDVAPRLKLLSGAKVRDWILPEAQEQKYLAACTEPLKTVAIIMLDAGLRPKECHTLRWENLRWIDANRAIVEVPGTKTEAAKRKVPMTPRVRAILQDRWLQAGKPLSGWIFPAKKAKAGHIVDNTIYEPHTNAVKNSGIRAPEFVLYSLRHTCLTRWGASGMDAWTLARFAGHSNIKQSMTYVHPTEQTQYAAFDKSIIVKGGDEIGDNAELVTSPTEPGFITYSSIGRS